MSQAQEMIILKQVSKTFQQAEGQLHQAIADVSLTIAQNEIFGLIGQSGAGKSTLLRFINALENPDKGSVTVAGQDVLQLSNKQLRHFRQSVSMIFQQFNLLNNLTVAENIYLPLKLHRYPDALSVEEVLSFVGLADKSNQYPAQLSGGQKQRVGIARALITRPQIMLCDEPTSALDEQTTDEIVKVLHDVQQNFHICMVIVTHELSVIKQLCSRVGILDAGHLVDVLNITPQLNANNHSYRDRIVEVLGHG